MLIFNVFNHNLENILYFRQRKVIFGDVATAQPPRWQTVFRCFLIKSPQAFVLTVLFSVGKSSLTCNKKKHGHMCTHASMGTTMASFICQRFQNLQLLSGVKAAVDTWRHIRQSDLTSHREDVHLRIHCTINTVSSSVTPHTNCSLLPLYFLSLRGKTGKATWKEQILWRMAHHPN